MPSLSAYKFQQRVNSLIYLRAISVEPRIRPITEHQKQIYLHSYLTGLVAAWDAYLKAVIKEYLSLTSNPLDVRYSAIYSLLNTYATTALGKFNTPNSENSRKILINATGYDPIGDWIWTAKGLTAIQTREYLNEILKVRHSFAHGFTMPAYLWTQSSTGKVRLTATAVDKVCLFLSFLVTQTDQGLQQTMITVHTINPSW